MPVYSFGQDSPLKFDIPDKLAKTYNDATLEFFKAQQRFNQKFGRDWDPVKEPIKIKWSKAHRKAWRDFGRIFDEANAAGVGDRLLVMETRPTSATKRWRVVEILEKAK